jgi:hypothetical protein
MIRAVGAILISNRGDLSSNLFNIMNAEARREIRGCSAEVGRLLPPSSSAATAELQFTAYAGRSMACITVAAKKAAYTTYISSR